MSVQGSGWGNNEGRRAPQLTARPASRKLPSQVPPHPEQITEAEQRIAEEWYATASTAERLAYWRQLNRRKEQPMTEIGAIIFRRSAGFWSIDEFAHDGTYLGGHGGNHAFPRIEGWKRTIEWPDEPTLLVDLKIPDYASNARIPDVVGRIAEYVQ